MPSAGVFFRLPDLVFEAALGIDVADPLLRRKAFRSSEKSKFDNRFVEVVAFRRRFTLSPCVFRERPAPANIGSNQSSSILSRSWSSTCTTTEFARLTGADGLRRVGIGVEMSDSDSSPPSENSRTFLPEAGVALLCILRATPFCGAVWAPGDPRPAGSTPTACCFEFVLRSMLSHEAGKTPRIRLRSLLSNL